MITAFRTVCRPIQLLPSVISFILAMLEQADALERERGDTQFL
jgi:hypothetical protein